MLSVTNTITNIRTTIKGKLCFDVYSRSTGDALRMGNSSYLFYVDRKSLLNLKFKYFNPKFNEKNRYGYGYGVPMLKMVADKIIFVQIFNLGTYANEISKRKPYGEKIFTIKADINMEFPITNLRWNIIDSYVINPEFSLIDQTFQIIQ